MIAFNEAEVLADDAVLSIGTAAASLKIGDCSDERPVTGVRAAVGKCCAALATENGLQA